MAVIKQEPAQSGENWIAKWLKLIDTGATRIALDIGCGGGADTEFLLERGFRVLSFDISEEALKECKLKMPGNAFLKVDLRQGLPFKTESVDLAVASLSLHFFGALKSLEVIADLRGRLKSGGWLLTRLNSTRDIQPRIADEPELEPNLYQTRNLLKRFYDEAMVKELFQDGWRIDRMKEIFSYYRGKPKLFWEVSAQRL